MEENSTSYTVADAPELAKLLIAAHSPTGNPDVEKVLRRFLWNAGAFEYCRSLAQAAQVLARGEFSNFVYDKQSRMVFLDCPAGHHQILMAHLEGLHQTNMSEKVDDWFAKVNSGYNATSRLAEAFVEQGHGLFLSSVSRGMKITLGEKFVFDVEELAAFEKFRRDFI